ncbi:oxidoreductase, partial [Leucobacter sp. OAMSW11]
MNNLLRLHEGEAQRVEDDAWSLVRGVDDALPDGPLILPLAL